MYSKSDIKYNIHKPVITVSWNIYKVFYKQKYGMYFNLMSTYDLTQEFCVLHIKTD